MTANNTKKFRFIVRIINTKVQKYEIIINFPLSIINY